MPSRILLLRYFYRTVLIGLSASVLFVGEPSLYADSPPASITHENILQLKEKDPAAFQQWVQQKKQRLRERLVRLRQEDPRAFQSLISQHYLSRREKLLGLKGKNPEFFNQLANRQRQQLKERIRAFRQRNPEAFEEIRRRIASQEYGPFSQRMALFRKKRLFDSETRPAARKRFSQWQRKQDDGIQQTPSSAESLSPELKARILKEKKAIELREKESRSRESGAWQLREKDSFQWGPWLKKKKDFYVRQDAIGLFDDKRKRQ